MFPCSNIQKLHQWPLSYSLFGSQWDFFCILSDKEHIERRLEFQLSFVPRYNIYSTAKWQCHSMTYQFKLHSCQQDVHCARWLDVCSVYTCSGAKNVCHTHHCWQCDVYIVLISVICTPSTDINFRCYAIHCKNSFDPFRVTLVAVAAVMIRLHYCGMCASL